MTGVEQIQLPFERAQQFIVDLVSVSQAQDRRPLHCAQLCFEPVILLIVRHIQRSCCGSCIRLFESPLYK